MSIVVVVPVYQRPHRVQPLLASFTNSRSAARLLFVASPEDKPQLVALNGIDHLVLPARRRSGDWARKINYGYHNTSEEWIVCCGDDVHFHKGWDTAIIRESRKTKARVIGTSDMNPRADILGIYSPHPAVHRSYADELGSVDRPGEIMCELYDHNYPDRELAATAIHRGEWAFAKHAIIEHLHPCFSGLPNDRTYALGRRQFGRDGRLFRQRSKRWQ